MKKTSCSLSVIAGVPRASTASPRPSMGSRAERRGLANMKICDAPVHTDSGPPAHPNFVRKIQYVIAGLAQTPPALMIGAHLAGSRAAHILMRSHSLGQAV